MLGYAREADDENNINSNENNNLIVNLDEAMAVYMQLKSNPPNISNPSSLITTNQQQSLPQNIRNPQSKKDLTENISSYGLRSLMYEKEK